MFADHPQNFMRLNDWTSDEALLLESHILALSPPTARSLILFKFWFSLAPVPVLWGYDEHLFDREKDLVALAPADTDRLNQFLITYFGYFFQVCPNTRVPFAADRIT